MLILALSIQIGFVKYISKIGTNILSKQILLFIMTLLYDW